MSSDSSPVRDAEAAPPPSLPSAKAEGARAARNAIKLALSLTATWTVALVVKFQLPRHLGPLSFGNYNFSEAFAAAFIAFLGLGIEVHIQKEVAVRPDTASSFFGGVVLLRLLLSIPLFAAMLLTLYWTGRGERLPLLVISFGCAQFVAGLNGTLAAMLQATARINVLAAVNVAAKLVWGVGIAVGVMLDWPIFVLTLPSLASELLRWAVLYRAARSEIGLRFKNRRRGDEGRAASEPALLREHHLHRSDEPHRRLGVGVLVARRRGGLVRRR
ncbi:MAG: oligosaccharide flippase family protein [Polyangiaceae bacterium]